jgi:hypothetical protein
MESEDGICSKCQEEKSLTLFASNGKGGYRNICKACYNKKCRKMRTTIVKTQKTYDKNAIAEDQKEESEKVQDEILDKMSSIIGNITEISNEELAGHGRIFGPMLIERKNNIRFPPTREIILPASDLLCPSQHSSVAIPFIKSHLCLFLNNKKNIQTDTAIVENKTLYNSINVYKITLPKDVTFNHSELNEFNRSVITVNNGQKVCRLELPIGKRYVSARKIEKILQASLLNHCGVNLPDDEVQIIYENPKNPVLVLKWPYEYAGNSVEEINMKNDFTAFLIKRKNAFDLKKSPEAMAASLIKIEAILSLHTSTLVRIENKK